MTENAPRRALVTGINGFCGSHLAELLLSEGWEVHGTVRSFRSDLRNLRDLEHAGNMPTLHYCDIMDGGAVADVVKKVQPNAVFHLAAQSYVPASWTNPHHTLTTNVLGTLNVLEAVRRHAPAAVCQVAGTSEEYGRVEPDECPITEDSPLRPLSPYGVSKCAADLLGRQYAASYGLNVVVTRAYNHSGQRRGVLFAESDWARQIALAELAGGGTIRHGNLEAVRDYSHVRDIARGYIAAVTRGKPGEVYQLCSGDGWKMGDVLERLISLSKAQIKTEIDKSRMRPSDVPLLIGSPLKAERELGWSTEIPVKDMLLDLLDYWRQEVSARDRLVA